jgi:anti-sigma factor RsiW
MPAGASHLDKDMKQDDIKTCREFEEHLTPYVDGEAEVEAQRAADLHMAKCPPCRQHMEAERTARALVRDKQSQLRGSAPARLRARCAAQRAPARTLPRLRRWVPMSLAATLLLAVGTVFLVSINSGVEALAAGLTLDHVNCFKRSSPADSADAHSVSRSWEQRQGWPITVPETTPSENLRLIDVRRCLSTEGRVAHLMYLWQGSPFSVYVLPRSVGRDRMMDSMGHQMAIWSTNGRTYAALATGHPQDFDHIVEYMKNHTR